MSTIIAVAAHGDDEIIGCSGTLAKHIAAGDQVHIIIMTNGVGARSHAEDAVRRRALMSEEAACLLGVASLIQLDFPDNKMDSCNLLAIVQSLEMRFSLIKPDIIYTHHVGDLNIDHEITHKAVMTASRPQPGCSVKEIYTFEVQSSTEWGLQGSPAFIPSTYVDIGEFMTVKQKLLTIYAPEMREPPHTRSIQNILRVNKVRGSSVGLAAAEAFMCVRRIL